MAKKSSKKTSSKSKSVSKKSVSKKSMSSKKTTSKKVASKTPVTKTTTTATVPTTTTVTSTTAASVSVPVVPSINFDTVRATIGVVTDALKVLRGQVKTLEKSTRKLERELEKKSKKKSKSTRAPSGFAKTSKISKELCAFLNKPVNTEMARTEVTKHLTQYIKQHNLQNPENKKQIQPDSSLAKLLGPLQQEDKEKGYTYFNLQKYMKHHFPKSSKTSKSVSSN